MPLFVCEGCTAIENTALSPGYWMGDKRCSECIKGRWHGRFPKDYYDPKKWQPAEYNSDFVERRELKKK